jgi:Protein of unknown function (DUF3306)
VTDRDSFILRWARLKREQDMARELEGGAASVEATTARAPGDAAAAAPFDLASLPSIESIVADTNIGAFLQSGVPAELTRAALRRAWESDPAIRDFIGIAENQWDFNDPDAIPGFGPLHASDNAPALLAQVSGWSEDIREALAEAPVPVEYDQPSPIDPGRRTARHGAQLTSGEPSSADSGNTSPSSETGEADAKRGRAAIVEQSDAPRHRRHGSALPR